MISVTVVTAWHDLHELAPAYWRAMEAGLSEDDRVIVVDNGSKPALAADYRARTGVAPPSWATFARSRVNLGFSPACNAGLERAGTDAVLWLNNDIVMTSATWLQQIRSALKPGRLVGASLYRDAPHARVDGQPVPYLDGWCLAGMVADLVALKGFDTDFEEPSYYGDNDLCVRACMAGMELVGVDVGLKHLRNRTSRRIAGKEAIADRNRARYERTARLLLEVAA